MDTDSSCPCWQVWGLAIFIVALVFCLSSSLSAKLVYSRMYPTTTPTPTPPQNNQVTA